MQFTLVDRILEIEPGRRIIAVKNLTLAEEYLAEHFPGFPVLPGVLMLEAMAQAAGWLIRVTDGYAQSMVLLRGAKAVKYGSFVTPGKQLTLELEITAHGETETELRGRGTVDGALAVSGRITMEHYNLADRAPALEDVDRQLIESLRQRFAQVARAWLLQRPGPSAPSRPAVRAV